MKAKKADAPTFLVINTDYPTVRGITMGLLNRMIRNEIKSEIEGYDPNQSERMKNETKATIKFLVEMLP